jgi:hypothetical protein
MHAHATTTPRNAEKLEVVRQDLIAAWSILERLVISTHRIGSAGSTPTAQEFTNEARRAMYEEIGKFVAEHVVEDANQLRIVLAKYLPEEDVERLSDELHYWQAEQK